MNCGRVIFRDVERDMVNLLKELIEDMLHTLGRVSPTSEVDVSDDITDR